MVDGPAIKATGSFGERHSAIACLDDVMMAANEDVLREGYRH